MVRGALQLPELELLPLLMGTSRHGPRCRVLAWWDADLLPACRSLRLAPLVQSGALHLEAPAHVFHQDVEKQARKAGRTCPGVALSSVAGAGAGLVPAARSCGPFLCAALTSVLLQSQSLSHGGFIGSAEHFCQAGAPSAGRQGRPC